MVAGLAVLLGYAVGALAIEAPYGYGCDPCQIYQYYIDAKKSTQNMGIISSVFGFLWGALKKLGSLFSAIPSKLAVLVTGLGAVVAEIAAFVDSLMTWFTSMFNGLDSVFRQFAALVTASDIFNLFSYCLAFDVLVTIFASVVGLVASVLTFIFVTLVHAVLIFFGLRFGYSVYKYLVTSFSNGLSKA